ncbi:MAG: hypothetical protein QM496_15360 [Verrucomicrobiota bacterium]
MLPISFYLILLCTYLTLSPIRTSAFTTDFFPGDSHFTTDLSQRSLKQIKTEAGLQFNYYVIAGHTMFCGHAGFLTLKFETDNSKLKNNYIKTAAILFKKFKLDIDSYNTPSPAEEDYFPVFVYNRDFDFKLAAIGPRYNEDWESVQLNLFGLPHSRYPGFTQDPYLLNADFQNSKKIRPLDLILPLPHIQKFSPKMKTPWAISTPLRMKSSKVQIIILAGGSYEISAFAKAQPLRTLFRITEDSIERFEADFKGQWQKVALNAARNKASDKVRATLKN